MTDNLEQRLLLGLNSGKQLSTGRIILYPEPEMQHVLLLKSKAQEELGGFSTGLGFWGSPGWVIGGAAALGLVESMISNSKMKKGMELLKEAAIQYEQLKRKGTFFNINSIEEIHQPHPTAWKAKKVAEFQINLNPFGLLEKSNIMQRYDISRKQVADGIATATGPIGFIHNEDEFVEFEIEGRRVSVRWSSIEYYHLA